MKNLATKSKEKKKFCVQTDCKRGATTRGFCRLHYIANHSAIKLSQQIKAEQRLNAYVDRIAKKYPDDYMERIKAGLENEEKFKETVQDLDLENSEEPTETEREYLEKFLRNLKGE